MSKLRRDLQTLNTRLQAEPQQSSASVSLEGPGTVQLSLPRSEARVAIILADDSYPRAAVLVLCESDDTINSQLEELNELFEDGADLELIVTSIFAALGITCCLGREQPSQDAAEMEAEGEQEAQGSDIDDARIDDSGAEQEESEDDADDEAYDVAERDDEELLKTVFQKVSRWDQKEAAIIKARHAQLRHADACFPMRPCLWCKSAAYPHENSDPETLATCSSY